MESLSPEIKFTAFYENQMFIIVFTRAHHWALTPHFCKIYFNC